MMLALVLDLGSLHAWQTSDSLVPSLVSLQAWTPFFWQQDRYGMLMPLLFGGITHPLYNQLAITWASVMGGLCAAMAVAQLLFGTLRVWPLIGLSCIALMLASAPKALLFDVLGPGQFFSTPLAMGLGAVWLLQHRPRARVRAGALVLLCLAAWVNCVMPVWIGLLVGAQQGLGTSEPWRPRILRVLRDNAWVWASLSFAGGVGLALRRLAPVQDAVLTDVAGPYATAHACLELTRAWARLVAASPVWLGCMASLCVLGCVHIVTRKAVPALGRGMLQASSACGMYMVLCASQRWVAQGGYHYRFWLPAACVSAVACVGVAIGPRLHRLSSGAQARLTGALECVILLVALLRFGPPSISGVRHTYDDLGGAWARQARALHCTHLAGSYWRVWPAVFAASIEAYEADDASQLLGVTDRAEATVHLWPSDQARWRLCVPRADPVSLSYVQGIAQIRFAATAHGAQLDVLTPLAQAR